MRKRNVRARAAPDAADHTGERLSRPIQYRLAADGPAPDAAVCQDIGARYDTRLMKC